MLQSHHNKLQNLLIEYCSQYVSERISEVDESTTGLSAAEEEVKVEVEEIKKEEEEEECGQEDETMENSTEEECTQAKIIETLKKKVAELEARDAMNREKISSMTATHIAMTNQLIKQLKEARKRAEESETKLKAVKGGILDMFKRQMPQPKS